MPALFLILVHTFIFFIFLVVVNFRLDIVVRVAFLFRRASGRFYPQRETSVFGLRGSSSQGRQRHFLSQCLPDRCCCLAGLSGSSTFLLPCIPNVAAEDSPQSTELLVPSFLFLAWCARLHVSLSPSYRINQSC